MSDQQPSDRIAADRAPAPGALDAPRAGADAVVAVVIPVKSFTLAKGRLAESLSGPDRHRLAQEMATRVVAAAAPLPTWIACNDHTVARWAQEVGARVLWRSQPGLNSSVAAAVTFLARIGVDRVVIAHGDLPLARDLSWVGDFDGVTIVPDRRGGGTNVMAVPTGPGFEYAYGEGSAPKHRAEAERHGLPVRVVPDDELGWDVDTPEDLAVLDLSPPLPLSLSLSLSLSRGGGASPDPGATP